MKDEKEKLVEVFVVQELYKAMDQSFTPNDRHSRRSLLSAFGDIFSFPAVAWDGNSPVADALCALRLMPGTTPRLQDWTKKHQQRVFTCFFHHVALNCES